MFVTTKNGDYLNVAFIKKITIHFFSPNQVWVEAVVDDKEILLDSGPCSIDLWEQNKARIKKLWWSCFNSTPPEANTITIDDWLKKRVLPFVTKVSENNNGGEQQ